MTRRVTTISLFLLIVTITPSLWALSVEEEKRLAKVGIELLLKRDYPEAKRFTEELLREDPESCLSYFGMMAYAQIRNFENYDFRFEKEYEPWGERGRRKAIEVLKNSGSRPWDLLIAGGILGISGFDYSHRGKWLMGLRDALQAVKVLKEAIKRDPEFHDPLLGIGLYEYWRSYYTRVLIWLPFFPDRRREGRVMIEEAEKKGEVVRPLALFGRSTIDLHERRFEELLKGLDPLISRYPRNTVLRMLRGRALMGLKRYREAVVDFEKILETDPSLTKGHLFLGLALSREGKDLKRAGSELALFLRSEKRAGRHWRQPAEEELRRLRGR